MGLKKGMTNNPNGRKKGIPNKSTQAIKDTLAPIISGQLDTLESDLQALKRDSIKDYIDAISKLLPYIAPKYSSTNIEGEISVQAKQIFEIGGKKIEF